MIRERTGHFHDGCKPEGFNTKRVFVSPSVNYAGLEVYAASSRYVFFLEFVIVKCSALAWQLGFLSAYMENLIAKGTWDIPQLPPVAPAPFFFKTNV